MRNPRVGAPPGNTVHWLHMELSGEFTKTYRLNFNWHFHHYRYARFYKRTLIDEFLVVRTSKKCYRVIYFNCVFQYFKYFSARNYRECADKMKNIYKTFKEMEE